MVFGHLFLNRDATGNETLDRPANNFDVAGIPVGEWSSPIYAVYENFIPSCLFSFFAAPIIWAQIVVRAQIPLLIDFKNYFYALRTSSGYRFFIDLYIWVLGLGVGLLLLFLLLPSSTPSIARLFCIVIAAPLLLLFVCVMGIVRTSFRMKYHLPGWFPDGWESWDVLWDMLLTCLCHPCALAQWRPSVGCFCGDPSGLAPLTSTSSRPQEADTAGLVWLDNRSYPDRYSGRGNDTRSPTAVTQQPVRTFATPSQNYSNASPAYDAEGRRIV